MLQSNYSPRTTASTLDKDILSELQAVKRRIWWPIGIILGQATLLSLAWGFFYAVRTQGQIPLDPTTQYLVHLHPQCKTYLVTFVATSLSTFSSYLFSQVIRHAILVCLTRPMSVATLGFGISISRRSMIFEKGALGWVLIGGTFFLATLGQTASWTSLLTPNSIVVPTPLQGTEIDLTSGIFNDESQFLQIWNGTPSGISYFLGSAFSSVIGTSGAASADIQVGYVSVLDFEDWIHVGTTDGVLPIDYRPDSPLSDLLTSNTQSLPPMGSDFNISMNQQGLTANISCQSQQLNENTNPPLFRSFTPVLGNVSLNGGDPQSFVVVSMSTVCPGGGTRPHQDMLSSSSTYDTLMALSCINTDTESGLTTYSLIIDGLGMYATQSAVCTIVPQTNDFIVSYSDGFVYKNLDGQGPTNPQVASALHWVTYAVAIGMEQAFAYGQSGTSRHVIGDTLAVAYNDRMRTLSYADLWVAYINGVASFIATVMKSRLASKDGPFGSQGPPLEMLRAIHGTAFTTTLGWQNREGAGNYAMLLPITFVGAATMLIALVVGGRIVSEGIPDRHASFDPSDSLQLVAAASSGGVLGVFGGLAKEDIKQGKMKRVKLDVIDGRDGLVQVF